MGKTRVEETSMGGQKVNCFRFDDPRIQRLSDLWLTQRVIATADQKDQIGFAYIIHILGFDRAMAESFVRGDHKAEHAIGMKQSALPCDGDFASFWKKVKEIFPETHRDEDIEWLIQERDVVAVCHLLNQLEEPLAWASQVLRALAINAHVYK
jgi:hypothetical protein